MDNQQPEPHTPMPPETRKAFDSLIGKHSETPQEQLRALQEASINAMVPGFRKAMQEWEDSLWATNQGPSSR